jgi:hypothetical protein
LEQFGKRGVTRGAISNATLLMGAEHISKQSVSFSTIDLKRLNIHEIKMPDETMIFEELEEHNESNDHLLEDMFLKNQLPNKSVSDPFHKD